jgi:Tol biopolymer transport system component
VPQTAVAAESRHVHYGRVSPDGRRIAYSAAGNDGVWQIHVRALADTAQPSR